jgi:hypothetical protein
MLSVTILLLLLAGGARLERNVDPIVTTHQGNMRGITMTSRSGRTFYAFLGIPYAAPPVGALRFKVSVQEWSSHLIKVWHEQGCQLLAHGPQMILKIKCLNIL